MTGKEIRPLTELDVTVEGLLPAGSTPSIPLYLIMTLCTALLCAIILFIAGGA